MERKYNNKQSFINIIKKEAVIPGILDGTLIGSEIFLLAQGRALL